MRVKTFKHVNYLWDDEKAAKLKGDEMGLFLYRSNLLGADLRITNYGGGNTSCKKVEIDPLTGREVEVMWIKGSGGDLGTLTREGVAGLFVNRLQALKQVYGGLEFEDEMVGLFNHCIYNLDSSTPSIDTPLHGLLPFKHIDHLHPDALIAIAAAKDSAAITQEIWGHTMGWVPWQRPGFDLAIQLERYLQEHPGIRGIVLGGHGLFTWGETSYECYMNSFEVIETASQYIQDHIGARGPVFGGQITESLEATARREQAALLMPVLRGLCSSHCKMIGHFTDDKRVLEFVNSKDINRLAPLGTSCPDHFLRTKIQPLVLQLSQEANLNDYKVVREQIEQQFVNYRNSYMEYYEQCKRPNSPAMRDTNPVVILYPGVGMFTFAKDKQTARIASEFYINAINVMRGAEAISEYTSLQRQEAFDIEYWLLEEAKLKRQQPDKALSGRVAVISGADGGIGLAIAKKLAEEGANVVLLDIAENVVEQSNGTFDKDVSMSKVCDVSDPESVARTIDQVCLEFGGVDIVVHSAGLAISKPLEETTLKDWNLLQNVFIKGQLLLAQQGVKVMRKQGFGGDIIHIASKNGLVSGPNNVAYGTAKAAQQHMTRLLAAELGKDNIRVNTVNPDGVIIGSKIWTGEWAEGRAKAHGIKVEDLPNHYAKRNLLNEILLPEDVADAVYGLVAILRKSTGNTINVDGGIAAAFVR